MLMKDLESARRTLNDKMEELEGANTNARSAEVRSPVTGTVVSRKGVVGDEIHAGAESSELFGITPDISALEVVLEPQPSVLERLTPDTPTLVILADVPEPLNASIREAQGSLVFVPFTSPSPLVRPGMTAQVRLKLD
jgi:hypothetical protein